MNILFIQIQLLNFHVGYAGLVNTMLQVILLNLIARYETLLHIVAAID